MSDFPTNWQAVIGLEVHAQLQTQSKIFSAAPTHYGAEPNAQACALSIALPGTLPVFNLEAARLAVRFGLAINAQINRHSVFARKHYFYPDLPKGYQISQFEHPIIGEGELSVATEHGEKLIRIERAHLEEDAGKSLHEAFHGMSGIDLNRAGTPLLEIVTKPDLSSAGEAVAFLRKLHGLVRYLGVCDGNMQQGSFRCDANVSVKPREQRELGVRTELKNINSFRFVERAIQYEIARQIEVLESGAEIVQETRLYDETRDQTRPMRSKEEAHDYRYFPDPDLPALRLSESFVEEVRAQLPELPAIREARFQTEFGLSATDAAKIVNERELADYFESSLQQSEAEPKLIANWLLGEFAAALNKHATTIACTPITPAQFAELLNRVADQTISGKIAKQVFEALWRGEGEVDAIIDARGLRQISDQAELSRRIDEVLQAHPTQVQQYLDGEQKVFGFLVGQVMKATAGKANPQQVNEILRGKL